MFLEGMLLLAFTLLKYFVLVHHIPEFGLHIPSFYSLGLEVRQILDYFSLVFTDQRNLSMEQSMAKV